MKTSFRIRTAAAVGLAAVLLAACGRSADGGGVPNLIEPSATNYAYRPAEYGNIGNTSIILGTVVPKSHCFFYEENVRISELAVEVGDTVAPGDILAYADIEYARSRLDSLSDSLDNENTVYDSNRKIAGEELKKLDIYRQEALDSGDADTVKRLEVSAATSRENMRYDEMLHNARVNDITKQIEAQQEIVDAGTLTSDCNGMVAYIKNIAEERYAGANENVVIVCDSDEAYIELDVKVNEYKYSSYEIKYLQIGSDRYEALEVSYSPSELAVAKVQDAYPNVRIACPEGVAFNVGDTYPVYFREKDSGNMLVVGNDSLYSDEGGSFVYVKTEGQSREKRYIQTGIRDNNYTEVVSGISEGEQVYYESTSVVPSDYTEYKTQLSDFEIKNHSQKYELADNLNLLQNSEYEGEILEICVNKDQKVAKGDLLYIIDSGEGRAALAKAELDIEREKESYAADLEHFEKELERLQNENSPVTACDIRILEYRKKMSVYSHERRLASLQKYYDELHEGNDGSGRISVYSSYDGTVANIEAKVHDKVRVGDNIMTVAIASNPKMYVAMVSGQGLITSEDSTDDIADIGETILFDFPQMQYSGECIGWTVGGGNAAKVYLFTDEEGVHLTRSASRSNKAGFYVRLDEEAYDMPLSGTVSFPYVRMTDVLVLAANMVNQEADGKTFVWRITDGQLVKQYVLVDEMLKDGQNRVILSGINPGDVLAVPY